MTVRYARRRDETRLLVATFTALAALLSIAVLLLTAGCNVGDSSQLDDSFKRPCGKGGGPKYIPCPDAAPMADAAPPVMIDAAPPPPPPDAAPPPPPDAAPPPTNCDPAVATTNSGHHNAGKDCHGCHDGGHAVLWTVAGTLYDSVSGNSPVAGATIHVTDANGQQLTLITALNGNFYTSQTVSYPLTVSGSQCPYNVAMSEPVPSPASCNASGCHASGFRIHLP